MENIGGPEARKRDTAPPPPISTPSSEGGAPLDVTHRRNRLVGMWAAELLGLIGQAASDYARGVMHPHHTQDKIHGDDQEDVVGMLSSDLAGRASIAEIRDKMTHFLSEAKRQILHEKRD